MLMSQEKCLLSLTLFPPNEKKKKQKLRFFPSREDRKKYELSAAPEVKLCGV